MMGVRFVAQIVEHSPAWIFNHDENVEILRVRRLAVQDFIVTHDDQWHSDARM